MYLVINLGLKSIRGIVFDGEGKQVYSCSRAVYSTLVANQVEQDVQEWAENLDTLLQEIYSAELLGKGIKYITATTSSSCIYGADVNGRPLTKVMMVSDKRAFEESRILEDLISDKEEFRDLRCPESSIIPKALWFRNKKPETYNKVSHWMGAGEFLNHFFTESIFTDPLNASKGLFTNAGYPARLLEEAGLDSATLPPVKDIGFELPVSDKLVARYGMKHGTRFVLTTYDAICAVIGSYDGDPTTACDVSGTVTSVRVFSDLELSGGIGNVLSQKLCNYNKYLIGASNNLGGGIIEWFKQSFFDENDRNVYYKMENYADQIPIGANGIVFLPYMLGERSPFNNPDARGVFFGIDRRSTLKEFSRAVFESTAYVTNDLLNLITDNKITVNALSVSGGLARFDLINQIKADVCNKQIKVIENFESTSVGALILIMISQGKFNSFEEASKDIVRIRKVINPSERNSRIYQEFFSFYKELNNQLMPLYESHRNLRSHIRNYTSEKLRNL